MKKFCLVIAVILVFVCSCDNLYNDVAEEKKDMQKLIFVNADGVSVDLTKDPYGITEWEGFSKVDLNLQTQQVPFHDGSVYLDGLLSERELSVTLAMNDEKNLEKRYRLRCELIEILNPKLGEGTLIYTNNYTSKQIKVIPQTPLFETHNSNDSGTPKASLAWTACDPYWEDIEETVVSIKNGLSVTILNNGDVPTNIRANIQGDSENFNIINQTTKKFINVKNIENLDECEIVTLTGKKEIINYKNKFKILNGNAYNGLYGDDKLTIYVGKYIAIEDINGNIDFINNDITLNDVTFGNNKYVAVGEQGTIKISQDGYEWISVTSPVSISLNSVCYGNNKYVAVGEQGTIISSSDAENWNLITSVTSKTLINVIYGNGIWVTNGTNILLRSTDTTAWNIIVDQNIDKYSNCAIYVAGRFFLGAVATSGFAFPYTSDNGENWTNLIFTLYESTYPDFNCKYLAYDGEKMIVSNGFTRTYSFNLINPTQGIIEKETSSLIFTKIKYIKQQNIYKTISSSYIGYGIDIFNWKNKFIYTHYTIAYGLNKFILFSKSGNSKYIFETTDGINLTQIGSYQNFNPRRGYFRENLFITVGESGKIQESSNGVDWSNTVLEYNDYLNCIVSGRFSLSPNTLIDVVVGNQGIYLRANMSSFSKVVTVSNAIYGVAFGNNMFLAVGNNAIYRKRSGTILYGDWETVFLGYHNWKSIAYGNGKFVIVGDSGWIAVTDGKGTENVIYGKVYNDVTTENISDIIYAENKFIMITENGNIYKSYNAYDWKFINGINCNVYQMAYGNGNFLCSGNHNVLAKDYNYEKENIIKKITPESDMNFDLVKGDNNIKINYDGKDMLCRITYRQKYIGV